MTFDPDEFYYLYMLHSLSIQLPENLEGYDTIPQVIICNSAVTIMHLTL